jgi:hypothetical protein|tara:strand:+ start:1184 stop:1345 length:162 start_codon:yes stop_codon:yes gene_type:complete
MEESLEYWELQLEQYKTDLENETSIENNDLTLKVLLEKNIVRCEEVIKKLKNG